MRSRSGLPGDDGNERKFIEMNDRANSWPYHGNVSRADHPPPDHCPFNIHFPLINRNDIYYDQIASWLFFALLLVLLSLSLSHLNIIDGGREYNSLVLFFPRFEIDGIREGEKCKYLVLKIEKAEARENYQTFTRDGESV